LEGRLDITGSTGVVDVARRTLTGPISRDGNAGIRIANGLRGDILRGELPPGSRIVQDDVAARFGASRLPVRAALSILERDGLVTLKANAGAWVSHLSLAECEEMYQHRERIEPLLLRYSAPNLSPAEIVELDDLAREMETASTVDEFLEMDRQFHLGSYAGASTTMLGETVQKLWNATQFYRRAFTEALDAHHSRVTHEEHHMIVEALRIGDVEHAEQVLIGHIRRTRMRLAQHPEIFAVAD
jgi:DNA-binding GntR family transcriptional regulator